MDLKRTSNITAITEAMPNVYLMLESNSEEIFFAKMVKDTQLIVCFYLLENNFYRVICGIISDREAKSIGDVMRFPHLRVFLSSPAFKDVAEAIKDLDFIIEY